MIELLLQYLALSVAFNLILFLIAYKFQSDKLTDASYALTFIAIAAGAFIASGQSPYGTIAFVMILLWAVRLGGFLLYRVLKMGKDTRFDAMRSSFIKFGGFWLLQGVSVWLLMIPFVLALNGGAAQPVALSYAGIAVFIIGLAIEAIADYQKALFKSNSANKGKWIENGLWRYSRHPNYFGEILVWFGVYLYAASSLGAVSAVVSLISPIYISMLLIFVSGVPILEKSADMRWGTDKQYQAYKRRTSVLFLLPPRH